MNPVLLPRVARELQWARMLTLRNTGPDVRRAQEWLSLAGFATTLDGEFGPATMAQVRAWQRRTSRPETGTLSLLELGALTAPLRRAFTVETPGESRSALLLTLLEAHLAQHPREVGGDNRGPWVRAYCGQDGAAFRWCAGFVLTLLEQVCLWRGETMPVPYTLSCDEAAIAAKRAGRLTHDPLRVRPGDLFLSYRMVGPDKDWYHTGMVTRRHADYFETGEGNTNDGGSANGFEACRRTRGFAQKDYLLVG